MAAADILRLRQGTPTTRFTLRVADRVFETWTALRLERDIADLAAGATLEFYDRARAGRAFDRAAYQAASWQPLACGQKCSLALDGEEVLRGWIAQFRSRLSATEMACSVTILDDAAHLVHCAAAPTGPAEYRNLTILQFAQRIAAPFGLRVWADVDVGAPFALIGIEAADTALVAIEKLARQRELLVTSDGVGGVLITRGGNTPAPAALRLGEQLLELEYQDDWEARFSDYYVKGQGGATPATRLDATASPLGASPTTPPPAVVAERPAVVMTGHAKDAEITLHRPSVRLAKTQSGGATVQQQADWQARVARGKGAEHNLTVLDFRAGPERQLWRANSLVLVDDPFNDVLEERLIGALAFVYGADGALTKLRVVRKGAFDLDPALRSRKRDRGEGRALDATPRELGSAL